MFLAWQTSKTLNNRETCTASPLSLHGSFNYTFFISFLIKKLWFYVTEKINNFMLVESFITERWWILWFFWGFGCLSLSSITSSLCEALNIRFNEILRSLYYFLHVLLGKPHIMLCNVMCFISHEIKYSAPDKKNFFLVSTPFGKASGVYSWLLMHASEYFIDQKFLMNVRRESLIIIYGDFSKFKLLFVRKFDFSLKFFGVSSSMLLQITTNLNGNYCIFQRKLMTLGNFHFQSRHKRTE